MALSAEVQQLFHTLIDLGGDDRARYFEAHETDPFIRKQVEELLACDAPSDGELTKLVGGHLQAVLEGPPPTDEAIRGPYRLLRFLGRGGMGEVWLAQRTDGLLKRPIALKLPYQGYRASHFAERLYRERDILSTLEHCGIARLYDAGFLEPGHPFLALEYIEGAYLSTYCNERQLAIKERLQLFLQVLEAVQYAHSRLVIHRDLKPTNILVTEQGEVKLLDFGIAKLLSEGEAVETELTKVEGRALTLSFASPEHISGKPASTASDVFSLGLVLADLLCGRALFIPKRESLAALEDCILTEAPRRPSALVTDEQQARERSTSLKRLRRTLKGDLDVIVLKAIQKRPEDRYPTAQAFRADIERYLNAEPVLAQPENALYRAGKFVKRHRLGVLALAGVFIALAAGLSVALWQAGIARKEARTADAVQEFTEDIFYTNSRSNPDPVKAQQTTARQLLDIGARKASASLQDAPEAKLRMLKMLGSLYQSLGVDDQAVSLEKDRLAAAEKLYGRESPELVRILLDLASCMHASRSVNERETVLLRAKAIVDKQHDFNSETRGRLLVGLAQHYTSSDLEKATRFAGESITVLRQYPLSGSYVSALYVAGLAYERSGEFAKSVSALDEAIAVSKRIDGDPNESLPRFYAHSAGAHEELGQYDSAERGYTLAYEYARKLGGDTDIDTLETESRLGSYLIDTSRFEQGLRLLQKATTDCLRVQGPDDPFYTPQMQLQLGMALEARDRPEEALREISAAVKNRQEHRPGTVYLAQMMEDEALVLIELGRLPEAERELSSAEQIRRKVNSKLTANFAIPRVQLELVRHHTGEALSLVERYYGPVNAEGQRSHDAMRNLLFRAEIAAQNRDGRSVASLMKQLQARLAAEQHVKYLRTWLAKSLFYEGVGRIQQGDFQGAVPVLQKAVDERTALLDRNSPELAITEAMLGQAYFGCRDFGHARSLLASAQSRLSAHKELNDTYKEPVRALGGYLSRISSTKKT